MKIGILESKYFSKKAISMLRELGEVTLFKTENNLIDFIEDKDIIYTRLGFHLDNDLINKSRKLKLIVSPTTGLNHINQKACRTKGIKIISLSGNHKLKKIKATPEHTFGLTLSLLRNYKYYYNLKNFDFKNDRLSKQSFELSKNKIGIIGYGRVGKILAKYFKAFGAEISYFDIKDITPLRKFKLSFFKRHKSINNLIKNSNIIILSASFEGKIIFEQEQLNLLKDKYFINTSRGENINEKYLLELIKKDHFKGIAIDNIKDENLNKNSLSEFEFLNQIKSNFIFTPHISGATINSINSTELIVTNKLIKYLKKHGQ